ncbi:MAG: serine/threonine-protein kinase [Proteobacteria bacterium]|nr:serine/threonine-protein kinase [Pseudomonadota bacterium]
MRTLFPTATGPVSPVRSRLTDVGCKAGPWIIESELGRGGMGTVYAVTHDTIGKKAALKVLHAELMSERNTARILLEARIVNRVSHPGIVDIFETGTLADGRAYLVMERLDGLSLSAYARAGKLLPTTVIDILLQICDALAAAHAAGIVHRDLKPDNVFLQNLPATPTVKLLDWGIAKVTTDIRHTLEGTLVGTPHYLSPEQARGGTITAQSDIYSLGIMAYELFLERLPFDADNAPEVLVMHLRETPPLPSLGWPDVPAELEALLLAMLAKAPEQRPTLAKVVRTLTAVRAELDRRVRVSSLIRTHAPTAQPYAPIAHASTQRLRTRRMPRWQVAIGSSVLLSLVALFAVGHASDAAGVTHDAVHRAESVTPLVHDARTRSTAARTVARPPTPDNDATVSLQPTVPSVMPVVAPSPAPSTTHPRARKLPRATSTAPRRGARIAPDGILESY